MGGVAYYISLNVLAHTAYMGGRMATALFALRLGASTFAVGVVMALFAVLPMLLSVQAGRLIDRTGPRRPMLGALATLACAAALPWALPALATLFVSSALIGASFMLMHISMNSVVGALGGPEQRPLNFSWLALGYSTSGALGPFVTGYAIDGLGHAGAFALLALFPALGLVLLVLRGRTVPRPEPGEPSARGRTFDLVRVPALRRVFLVSAVLATGWDLYAFFMPVYGARLGLPASTIGIIMTAFAAATFAVRLAMPVIMRMLRDWHLIGGALTIAGVVYLVFPLVTRVPLLIGLSCALGVGLGSAQPTIMAILFGTAPKGRQGEAFGIRTVMLNASQTTIPLFSGAVSALVGMAPVFWIVGAGLIAGGWLAARRRAT